MKRTNKSIAVYVRVSSSPQSTRSQRPDLTKWVNAYTTSKDTVKWYVDKASGKTMDRPQWNKLERLITSGMVSHLVVWRLDRLGRTASGLTKLFDELIKCKVEFISIKEGIDLSTPAGRLMANVLVSVAAYETEVGSERIRAGQAVARAAGKHWGGSQKGTLHKVTMEQVRQIVKMKTKGSRIGIISKTTGVATWNIYRVLQRVKEGYIKVA